MGCGRALVCRSGMCRRAVMLTSFLSRADADGWFHTGDIGELLPSGALRIIDRKKNLIKLAHGEYVAVEKLENQFRKADIVDQIWVHGDSEKASLLAVVVPAKEVLQEWGAAQGKRMDIVVRRPCACSRLRWLHCFCHTW
jgi:long-chain acyl-CoA synthetase